MAETTELIKLLTQQMEEQRRQFTEQLKQQEIARKEEAKLRQIEAEKQEKLRKEEAELRQIEAEKQEKLRKEEAEKNEILRREEQRQRDEYHRAELEALMQFVKGAPRHETADVAPNPAPVSTSAIPPFAAFDASTELWSDYSTRCLITRRIIARSA